ncbi:MAG TPA: transposase, partial [Ktedonobacteraceae bacterium]|nr:transposase [Ktedonobacteraceae bacterium]
MSFNSSDNVEVITDGGRRRRWSYDEKVRIVEESLAPGESVSRVARRNGVRPSQLWYWRKLMSEGGAVAVNSNEEVVARSEVTRLKQRIEELERALGRKTLENDILREAIERGDQK